MRTFVLTALLILTGCGVSTKTPAQTLSMTAKTWTVWVHSTADPNVVTVNGALSAGTCVTGVTGPACFNGSGLSNTSDDPTPTPTSLKIGVPVDPVPISTTGGYAFNFQYAYQTAGTASTITGSGQFYPNGNVSGTWQCTGGCSSASGAFTASQP